MAKKKVESNEPLGIVVADGGRAKQATRFSAFVWGPVPEDVEAEWEATARELELVHS